MLAVYRGYLAEVLMQYKGRLGGGCLLLISAGLIERFTLHSIPWAVYLWLLIVSFVIAMMVQGADQFRRLQPRLVIRNLESSEWPFERFGHTGIGWHFTVENLSQGESLENVHGQIVSIEPRPDYYRSLRL